MAVMQPQKFSFAFGATTPVSHVVTQKIFECGKFNSFLLITPNFTNVITTTIQVLDEEGNIVFQMTNELNRGAVITAQARNTTVFYQLDYPFPIYRSWTIQATTSGDAGGSGGTIVCKVYIEADKH